MGGEAPPGIGAMATSLCRVVMQTQASRTACAVARTVCTSDPMHDACGMSRCTVLSLSLCMYKDPEPVARSAPSLSAGRARGQSRSTCLGAPPSPPCACLREREPRASSALLPVRPQRRRHGSSDRLLFALLFFSVPSPQPPGPSPSYSVTRRTGGRAMHTATPDATCGRGGTGARTAFRTTVNELGAVQASRRNLSMQTDCTVQYSYCARQ